MSCLNLSKGLYATINGNILTSNLVSDFSNEIEQNERSRLHYMWIVPVNLGLSLIGIAIAPIAFIVNNIVAAIFKCVHCFTDQERDELIAQLFHLTSVIQLEFPIVSCIRIVNPTYSETPLADSYAECLGIRA
jgi:hypothetical protein